MVHPSLKIESLDMTLMTTNLKSWLCTAAALSFLSASTTLADTVTLNFDVHTPNGNPITDLFAFSSNASGLDALQAIPNDIAPSGRQSLSYQVPFSPDSVLIAGFNPAGADGINHIILFANPSFAPAFVGKPWSEAFAPMRHSTFINLITSAHDGDAQAFQSLLGFFRGPKAASASFDPAGAFDIVEFSTIAPPIGGSIPDSGSTAAGFLATGALTYALRGWFQRR